MLSGIVTPIVVCWAVAITALWRTRAMLRVRQIVKDATLIFLVTSPLALAVTTVMTLVPRYANTMGTYIMAEYGLVTGMVSILLIAAGGLRSTQIR